MTWQEEARAWAKGILVDLRTEKVLSGDDLAHKAGFKVRERDLRDMEIEGLALLPDRIYVQEGLNPGRRQFTVTHELAELWRPAVMTAPNPEDFHDTVAAHLLMPLGDFIRAIKQHGLNVRTLKLRFMHPSLEAIARHIPAAVLNASSAKWEGAGDDPRWRAIGDLVHLSDDVIEAEREALGDAYGLPSGYGTARRKGVWAYAWRTSAVKPNRGLTVVVSST